MNLVVSMFDLDKLGVTFNSNMSQDDKDKANLLVRILRDRFNEHVKRQIQNKAKWVVCA